MQSSKVLPVLCVIIVAIGIVKVANGHGSDQSTDVAVEKSIFKKLLDFKYYAAAFGKVYSSVVESMRRQKLFMARAIKIVAAAIGYRHHKSSYYLALNEFSDWTQDEYQTISSGSSPEADDEPPAISSHQQQPKSDSSSWLSQIGSQLMKFVISDGQQEDQEIARKVEQVVEVEKKIGGKLRVLDFRNIIKIPQLGETEEAPSEEPETGWRARARKMPRGGILSRLLGRKPATFADVIKGDMGACGGDVEKYLWEMSWNDKLAKMTKFYINQDGEAEENPDHEDSPADNFDSIDHRKSGCLSKVRHQGKCGSCHAFAFISIIEWLSCMQTGHLDQFSEQYYIDCGVKTNLTNGCSGGSLTGNMRLLQALGTERLAEYPYLAQQFVCPIDEQMPVQFTGFYRTTGPVVDSIISTEMASEALKLAPMYYRIYAMTDDFSQYGGGVWDNEQCQGELGHAVVIVGEGRSEGRDYWIIRNSYGPYWGEDGYMKLAKKSRCGDVWAQLVGFRLSERKLQFAENENHEVEIIDRFLDQLDLRRSRRS